MMSDLNIQVALSCLGKHHGSKTSHTRTGILYPFLACTASAESGGAQGRCCIDPLQVRQGAGYSLGLSGINRCGLMNASGISLCSRA